MLSTASLSELSWLTHCSTVLNGVCEGTCKTESGASYEVRLPPLLRLRAERAPDDLASTFVQPVGVSYSGPSFKFTILDTNGKKTFSQGARPAGSSPCRALVD